MYLLDTNVILELLLDQDRAGEVEELFEILPTDEICLSDFSLYSIGIILLRRREYGAFTKLASDLYAAGVAIMRLNTNDLLNVPDGAQQFTLNFDDAYQYTLAKNYDCTLVSFD
jgi:predicted nucleic acid-binding protein